MASAFERAHRGQLLGALTAVDRLIVHGHLSQLWFPNHRAYLLDRLGVRIARDFGRFVKQASSRVIAHAEALAKKAGRPFVYQDRVVHGKGDPACQRSPRSAVFSLAKGPRVGPRVAPPAPRAGPRLPARPRAARRRA
jgi:hypothetical protein